MKCGVCLSAQLGLSLLLRSDLLSIMRVSNITRIFFPIARKSSEDVVSYMLVAHCLNTRNCYDLI